MGTVPEAVIGVIAAAASISTPLGIVAILVLAGCAGLVLFQPKRPGALVVVLSSALFLAVLSTAWWLNMSAPGSAVSGRIPNPNSLLDIGAYFLFENFAVTTLGLVLGTALSIVANRRLAQAAIPFAVLDFRQWTFLNADLSVNFARQPVGDWILLDAESWIGPDGAGLAMARLADERGYFGRAIQSLVIEKRYEPQF